MPVLSRFSSLTAPPLTSNMNMIPTPVSGGALRSDINHGPIFDWSNIRCEFTIFRQDPSKINTDHSWVSVRQPRRIIVQIDLNTITWEEFKELIIDACEAQSSGLRTIISESFQGIGPKISWLGYILNSRNCPKCYPTSISDDEKFNIWIAELKTHTSFNAAGLFLKMVNPDHEAYINEALAQYAIRGQLEEEEKQRIASADFDNYIQKNEGDIDLPHLGPMKKELYRRYPVDHSLNPLCPIFKHPTIPLMYILLTDTAITIWAKALCLKVAGVDFQHPPRCLKYVAERSSVKRRNESTEESSSSSSNNTVTEGANTLTTFAQLVAEELHKRSRLDSPWPSDEEGDSTTNNKNEKPTMMDYLIYCNVVERHDALNKLLSLGIDDYRIFNSRYISIDDLKSIGLKIGSVIELKHNVKNFQKHLNQKKKNQYVSKKYLK